MAITAAMVKELRESTGAGMMECKKALTETNGDMDAAVEFLRKNGIMKAEKKASPARPVPCTGKRPSGPGRPRRLFCSPYPLSSGVSLKPALRGSS